MSVARQKNSDPVSSLVNLIPAAGIYIYLAIRFAGIEGSGSELTAGRTALNPG